MVAIHQHSCTLCEATCGITVTTDGDRVVDIRGDAHDPVSRGYICPKATALAVFPSFARPWNWRSHER